ncbi:MAG: hypothetical protein P9L99_13350 [Candidatus Lernaella stagnicola]|nr:hypothetical protein [Candidatus Lernaella stagnicola]
MLQKLIDMIQTAISVFADGRLTPEEAKDLLVKLAGLIKVIGFGLDDPKLKALLVGIADALAGIGEIVADPEHGVDDLLEGLGQLLIGLAAFLSEKKA